MEEITLVFYENQTVKKQNLRELSPCVISWRFTMRLWRFVPIPHVLGWTEPTSSSCAEPSKVLPRHSDQSPKSSPGPGMPYAPSTTCQVLKQVASSAWPLLPWSVGGWLMPSLHPRHWLDITSSDLPESLASLFPTSDHYHILHSTQHASKCFFFRHSCRSPPFEFKCCKIRHIVDFSLGHVQCLEWLWYGMVWYGMTVAWSGNI